MAGQDRQTIDELRRRNEEEDDPASAYWKDRNARRETRKERRQPKLEHGIRQRNTGKYETT